MDWQLKKIAKDLGVNSDSLPERVISHISIDSRTILQPESTLFIALSGERHNAHQYIPDLIKRGVKAFLVQEPVAGKATFISVNNTLAAFQLLAKIYRNQFSLEVIGVTGSNGKTIVKEWLWQCLRSKFTTVKSPKSYNSQVGVPLSLFQLSEAHEIGIFEAGISLPNEMQKLEQIIQPTLGVLTNLGSAHDEGFESREEKLAEKLKLFAHTQTIIYCSDHRLVHENITKYVPREKLFSWGKQGNDLRVEQVGELFKFQFSEGKFQLKLPFNDQASIENCVHVIAVLLLKGFNTEEIQTQIARLTAVDMRLKLTQGNYNSLIVDDSYSNDLPALDLALNFLKKHQQGKQAAVVLSDILESGLSNETLYLEVADLVNAVQPQFVVLIGTHITKFHSRFRGQVFAFDSTENFISQFDFAAFHQKILLIKGARRFAFEKIVKKISSSVHETTLEVNLDLMVHNLNYFKSQLKKTTKVMAMVKAYAYGSGYLEVAHALHFQQIDYLAVAYVDEGVDLRNNGIDTPIMVMNVEPENFDKLESHHLEPEVFRLDQLKAYGELAKSDFAIHLKLDTGMHRLGFDATEVDELIVALNTYPKVKIKSVFTHLSSADDITEQVFTENQLNLFDELALKIQNACNYPIMKHALNSAGIQFFPEHQYDMVRLGIGLYGIGVSEAARKNLAVIGTLKSRVSQVKTVAKGESIGYNRKWKAENEMKIATIAIGYADGYDRGFSNGVGQVFIANTIRPVVGNVCMDMIMVDVTGLTVKVNDEVELFGPNISWETQAQKINTISYELLTGIGERVKRVFYEG